MKLELTEQEVINIVKIIGSLPTSSNAYPLMMKVASQLREGQKQGGDDASAADTES